MGCAVQCPMNAPYGDLLAIQGEIWFNERLDTPPKDP